jgi:hypothetical protein
MRGGARPKLNTGGPWPLLRPRPRPCPPRLPKIVASKLVGDKWGRWMRWAASVVSDASACIALIDREGGKLSDDLVLSLVELLLLLGQCLERCVGSRSCCEVALVSQSRHLRHSCFGCIIVQIVGGKHIKSILLEWKGRGIPLLAQGGGRRIKRMLKGLLDYPAEFYPRFCALGKLVPILKCTDVQSRGEEEADCVHDQLLVSVEVFPQQCCLGAFLDVAEKNFGGISSQRASEDVIICFQG